MAAVCGAVSLGPSESGDLRLAAARSDLEGNEWLGEVQLCTASAAEGLTVVNRKRMRSGVTCVASVTGAVASAGSSFVAVGCDSGDAFLVRLPHTAEAESAAATHEEDDVEFDYGADAADVMGCHDNVVSCVAAMAGGRLSAAVGVTAAAACGEWVTALGFAHGAVGAVDARAVGRGMLLWAPHSHRGEVRSLAYAATASPGSAALVSGGECGVVRVSTFESDATAGAISGATVSAPTARKEAVAAVGFSSGSTGAWSVTQDGAFALLD
ncbi:hypothetical protein FNF27_06002 [Cafeteria roenbergensis]|uniref:Uncharacterized protein n=1 Tax=Cafeteria roenbergensis TaxID=33653 RepID=A0A5A8C737_CAFRO|nr:hypothetical protein FNF29_06458 [Cafeteria roenbergensis]KAA0158298.1 hypothetical protein FNF28_06306 [Cafeteria roenbergensis]KAA0172529.1 hypothetical protein FNF27_06002 [Cafeteria roenbergensis]|eukprot:KAA0148833.1 hypothetical protein FNF29_06458 [Cafeteria roenbergensis]